MTSIHIILIAYGSIYVTILFIFSFGHINNNSDECYLQIDLITQTVTTERVPKYNESEMNLIERAKKCFQFKSNKNLDIKLLLDDIMESDKTPKPGQSIFFHVTTCATNGRVTLNAR